MIIYLFLLLLDITPIFQYCQAYFVNHHFCFFEFLYIYTLSEQASFYCLEETRREWIANIQLNLFKKLLHLSKHFSNIYL